MDRLLSLLATYGLFFGIPLLFLAIVAYIYRSRARRRYIEDGRIPFDDTDRLDDTDRHPHD